MNLINNQQRKDLFYTLIGRLWRIISGPVMLLFIPLFLKPEQQGYWYLFGSISMLSVLADLGFSGIVLQFSAHEYAFLHFTDKDLLAGDELYLKRLGSLFRFIFRRILLLCIIVFPIIFIVGFAFFVRDGVLNVYLVPWLLYSFGAMINFFCNFIMSFIEGMDKITSIQKIRFIALVVYTGIVPVSLFLGINIYALAFGTLMSALVVPFLIVYKFKPIFKKLLDISSGFSYNWKNDINPLLTRYIIGGVFAYFVFQIYIPIVHFFHGPVYSGKVGITLALVMALVDISGIWIYTIVPKINMLISKKIWLELDLLFKKRMKFSLGTYILGILATFVAVYFFRNIWIFPKIFDRFLPFKSILILLSCYFFQLVISNLAIYLRSHKQEPLMGQAILAFCWVVPSTILAGKYLPPNWIFVGFLSSYLFLIPINLSIFFKCRKLWHT